ncbi:hypothetical protein, partial [Helicobacter didelphidarum]
MNENKQELDSKKLDSNSKEIKQDSKNQEFAKLDSHNDEMVFEVKYKLGLWDYCVNIFFFIPFSC